MTKTKVREWLFSRKAAPPPVLAERLEQVLAAYPEESLAVGGSITSAMGALGLATLGSLAGRDPRSVEVGLDLLAADAFVTFAFEAAAEERADVGPLVSWLLERAAA
ncbi:MAG: hypothetical protein Q8Q85_14955 [Gemmatimonadales bacterium]|nr:hypothetical protein [Gemmatimonadales bacterium]